MIFRGNEAKRQETIDLFKSLFDVVFNIKLQKEANEVFYLISKAGQEVVPSHYQKPYLTTQLHLMQKKIGTEWTKMMNTLEHLESMTFFAPKEEKAKLAPNPTEGKKKKKHKKH